MYPSFLHIVVVLVLVVLLFGANRVPNVAENLAKGIRSFKNALREDEDKDKESGKDEPKKEA